MSEDKVLPNGWIWTTVGDVALAFIGGGTPSTDNESYFTGSIPWMTVKDMRTRQPLDTIDHISEEAVRESATNIIPADTVIMATRISLGKVVRVPYATAINQDLKALITPPEVDKGYLEHWVAASADKLQSLGSGTTVKGIRLETLRQISFPLAPLAEQQRIVAAIEQQFTRLDAGVTALKSAQTRLKRYRAAVLKAAVEGKLTEAWRAEHPDTEPASVLLQRILAERRARWEADLQAKGKDPAKVRYEEPSGPDTSSLPALPEGWCWVSVEQVTRVQGGIQKQPSRAPKQNAFPYLRVANVLRGRLDLSEIEMMELFGDELATLRLEPGDLLIVEGNGSRSEIGRSALWNGAIKDCVHQNHIIRVRLQQGRPQYLDYYWNSPEGTRRVTDVAASTSGLYTLSVGKISRLPVPFPPLAEQEQIVAEVERRLSVVSELEAAVEANLKRAERLRQSILREAFSGQLVPQDLNDEPASVLLERIRQERQKDSRAVKWERERVPLLIPDRVEPVEARQAGLWDEEGDR